MTSVSATKLADVLGVSRVRVTQYVSDGKLDGCFKGSGKARRFDLEKALDRLDRKLDKGQMLGNGAETKKRLNRAKSGQSEPKKKTTKAQLTPAPKDEPTEYEKARTLKAIGEARKLQLSIAVDEERYVLAEEVDRQVQAQVLQEIAEFESVLRGGAQMIADEFDVDFKQVRKLLIDKWRAFRANRVKALEANADSAEMTPAELQEDI